MSQYSPSPDNSNPNNPKQEKTNPSTSCTPPTDLEIIKAAIETYSKQLTSHKTKKEQLESSYDGFKQETDKLNETLRKQIDNIVAAYDQDTKSLEEKIKQLEDEVAAGKDTLKKYLEFLNMESNIGIDLTKIETDLGAVAAQIPAVQYFLVSNVGKDLQDLKIIDSASFETGIYEAWAAKRQFEQANAKLTQARIDLDCRKQNRNETIKSEIQVLIQPPVQSQSGGK